MGCVRGGRLERSSVRFDFREADDDDRDARVEGSIAGALCVRSVVVVVVVVVVSVVQDVRRTQCFTICVRGWRRSERHSAQTARKILDGDDGNCQRDLSSVGEKKAAGEGWTDKVLTIAQKYWSREEKSGLAPTWNGGGERWRGF